MSTIEVLARNVQIGSLCQMQAEGTTCYIPPSIFISYSHKDFAHLERLKSHLEPFRRAGLIKVFVAEELKPGVDWPNAVSEALRSAKMAILLVSEDFLRSAYARDVEFEALRDKPIIPVVVRRCSYTTSFLRRFQEFNPDHPVAEMPPKHQGRLWTRLTDTIWCELFGAPEPFPGETMGEHFLDDLNGVWTGDEVLEVRGRQLPINVTMVLAAMTHKRIRGVWRGELKEDYDDEHRMGWGIAFSILGRYRSGQFVTLDYSTEEPGVTRFGTIILWKDPCARRMTGVIAGFSTLAQGITKGTMVLKKISTCASRDAVFSRTSAS